MTVPRLPAEGIHVICPGSTSNLGPGFDTLGMAIDRYLSLHLRPASDREQVTGLRVDRGGALATLGGAGPEGDAPNDDLIVSTLMARVGRLGGPMVLTAKSDIPIGRGLGSSAAARVAAEVLAAMLMAGEVEPRRILAYATAGEGHPDNVAPIVLGGLVAAGMGEHSAKGDGTPAGDPVPPTPDARPLPVAETIGWGFAAPKTGLPTRESRAVLPDGWPRDVVTRSLSRLARLIPALADPGTDGEHLRGLLNDELHVPYRLPMIPGGAEAAAVATSAGAWGVTLSGAGSGLIALGPATRMVPIVAAMSKAFGEGAEAFVLHPERRGVRWGSGAPPAID